ncbi:MAG: class I SAM-dependent RNA methyltransferase, partial [Pseudomonadota bacterium]
MSGAREIIRIAARGDGVTADGEHVVGTVPGDAVEADGTLTKGPHHVEPACRHFGICGGCQLQHADEDMLARFVRERVVNAAAGQDIAIGELLPEHLSPSHSRRRASLHGHKVKGGAVIGFREAGSHRVVDLEECPVLHEALFALIVPLRALLADHGPKGNVDAALTLCDQGVDLALTHFPID